MELFWQRFTRTAAQSHDITEFCKLTSLVLTVPLGSVENERRFSAMNLTKTELRNRLQTEHLNVAMRISGYLDVEAFPYRVAFDVWRDAKPRRGMEV